MMGEQGLDVGAGMVGAGKAGVNVPGQQVPVQQNQADDMQQRLEALKGL